MFSKITLSIAALTTLAGPPTISVLLAPTARALQATKQLVLQYLHLISQRLVLFGPVLRLL